MKAGWFRTIAVVLLAVWSVGVCAPRLFIYGCTQTGRQTVSWWGGQGGSCNACTALSGVCADENSASSTPDCCASSNARQVCQRSAESSGHRTGCGCCFVKTLDWSVDACSPVGYQLKVPPFTAQLFAPPAWGPVLPAVLQYVRRSVQRPPPLPVPSLLYFGCQRC